MTPLASRPGTLSCVVVNVNGLHDATKRRALFRGLTRMGVAVAVLCETHSRDDAQVRAWMQEGAGPGRPWEGEAVWHHGSARSRGVAVLVSPGVLQGPLVVQYRDEDGRVLLVHMQDSAGHLWDVMGVYAPVEPADRAAFFDTILTQACAASSAHAMLLVGGDLNCVTQVEDVQVGDPVAALHNSRLVGGEALRNLMLATNLTDVWRHLHPMAREYTRTTSSQHTVTRGRTSRWLIPEAMGHQGWELGCEHLHGELPGDHAAVVLRLQAPISPLWGKGHWRFPLYLLSDTGFVADMKKHIELMRAEVQEGEDPGVVWDRVKEGIRVFTQAATWDLARRRRQDREALRHKLAWVQAVARLNPDSLAAARAERAATRALQQDDEVEVTREGKALGALWAHYGERGTAWFHRLARPARDQTCLRLLKSLSGAAPADLATAEGVRQAGHALADFYDGDLPGGLFYPAATDAQVQARLLGAVQHGMDHDGQQHCVGPSPDGRLTQDCLRQALKAAPLGKTPGCDGLPYEFYQAFWGEVGDLLIAAFNGPFLSGGTSPRLHYSARTGLIVLVYKGGGKPRDDPVSYRPITLLNVDCKLVASVLTSRFGVALDGVIDPAQSAFVPGRWIGDNVLHHLEEVDLLSAEGLPGCIVGLDFAQAYDRIERGWLFQCMSVLGVPPQAARWVRLLLEGSQGMVVYNGHSSRLFNIVAGCAQGSPLSPLLYVMAAQPLAAMCRKLVAQGRVVPPMLGPLGLASPVHQHADDTTLHATSVQGVGVLLAEAVHPFCQASGAVVNLGKCWGMSLGDHPPLVGMHPDTGICFVAKGEAVRHLGVPLVDGCSDAAVAALYDRKLLTIRLRIRQWARFDLTLKGRAHVAKQSLASVLAYHATFLPVPQDQLRGICRVIQGFVWQGRLAEEGEALPGPRPAPAIASLPRDMGGIALVDVQCQVQALQAKVAAMLVHPAPASWKGMLTRALQRAFPQVGLAALLQRSTNLGRVRGLSSRQAAYLRAFRGLPLVRGVPHAHMSSRQVQLELLVGNPSVAGPDGMPFRYEGSLPAQLRSLGCLGHVPAAHRGLLKLPQGWEGLLAAQPEDDWLLAPDRVLWRRQQPGWQRYEVLSSGHVEEREGMCSHPPPQGQPVCVTSSGEPVPRGLLVGAWSVIQLDPGMWRVGDTPLLRYTVREATQALIHLQAGAGGKVGFCQGRGIRPKLWGPLSAGGDVGGPSAHDAVAAIHARQGQRMRDWSRAASSSRGGRRVAESDLSSQLYEAPWMRPSPARTPVLQRVEAAHVAVTQQRAMQQLQHDQVAGPLLDDTAWVTGPVPAWAAAWRRVHHARLPRCTQVFGWRLLHGALPVGGATLVFHQPGSAGLADCYCHAPPCRQANPRPLETLQHIFLECPVGKGALKWLGSLWGLIDPGGMVLALSPQVFLADDVSVWAPSQGLLPLWTLLRLTMLRCVWVCRCRARHAEGMGPTRAQVVGAFVREVRALILQDWACVVGDVRRMAGVPPSWFRGRDPGVSLEGFKREWCARGVLASVSIAADGRPVLTVHLSIHTPPGHGLQGVLGPTA